MGQAFGARPTPFGGGSEDRDTRPDARFTFGVDTPGTGDYPSPETTMTHPPPQVRLDFSESVELAFGADAPPLSRVTVNGAIVAAAS